MKMTMRGFSLVAPLLVLLQASGLESTRARAQTAEHLRVRRLPAVSNVSPSPTAEPNVFGKGKGVVTSKSSKAKSSKSSKATVGSKSKKSSSKGKKGYAYNDKEEYSRSPSTSPSATTAPTADGTMSSNNNSTMDMNGSPIAMPSPSTVSSGAPAPAPPTAGESPDAGLLIQMLEHLPESVSRQQVGDCVLNQNGFYGQPLGQPYRINFAYQVLLVEGTTQAQVSSQVTDSLDRAVPEALLPYYFACGDVRRNLQSGGTINGVSRLLTDTPIFSANCVGVSPDQECVVFSGSISVFATDFFTTDAVNAFVKQDIQRVMQSSVLNDVDLLVLDVQYIDDGFQTAEPVPTPPPTISRAPVASQAPTTAQPVAGTPAPITTQPTGSGPPTIVTTAPIGTPTSPAPTGETTQAPATTSAPIGGTTPAPTPRVSLPPAGGGGTPAPAGGGDTPAPSGSGGTPAPAGSGGTPAPNAAPTVTAPSTPQPTRAPAPPPPSPTATRSEPQGIDKITWWMWLLIGVGGALMLLAMWYMCCRSAGGGGGQKRASKRPQREEQANDDYEPPGGADAYVPPSPALSMGQSAMDTYNPPPSMAAPFTVEPSPTGSANMMGGNGLGAADEQEDYYDDEEGEEGEEEYEEGDEYYEDDVNEYGEEVEGEYDDEYGEEEYDDEEEGSYIEEEESYYEEETIGGGEGEPQQGWGYQ